MSVLSQLPARRGACSLTTILCLLLAHGPAHAGRSQVYWLPGITPWLDVFTSSPSEGNQRLYPLANGTTTTWSAQQNQPIQQGDQVVLHVWIAPGGGDIKQVRVTLDNVAQQPDQVKQIPNTDAAPADKTWKQEWTETIPTSSLAVGKHLINIWAQETGDPRGASNRSLTFDIVKQVPSLSTPTPVSKVKGWREELVNGVMTYVYSDSAEATGLQPLPESLGNKSVDEKATVSIEYRDAAAPSQSPTWPLNSTRVTVQKPTDFTVVQAPGSTATKFVYVLTRDGQSILPSREPQGWVDTSAGAARKMTTLIKLQPRTGDQPGLSPGPVTLWAWGIDAEGRPGPAAQVGLDMAP